jgi:hypothetical protein
MRKEHTMDEQILEKVKECAVTYLGMQQDDFVSVAEIFSDDETNTQRFDVKVQGKETPTIGQCFVVVKDGEASILTQQDDSSSTLL